MSGRRLLVAAVLLLVVVVGAILVLVGALNGGDEGEGGTRGACRFAATSCAGHLTPTR